MHGGGAVALAKGGDEAEVYVGGNVLALAGGGDCASGMHGWDLGTGERSTGMWSAKGGVSPIRS